MVVAETLEGLVDHCLWFHYDIANDVLYLRLASHRQFETVAEEPGTACLFSEFLTQTKSWG